jgi:hypothetical protein
MCGIDVGGEGGGRGERGGAWPVQGVGRGEPGREKGTGKRTCFACPARFPCPFVGAGMGPFGLLRVACLWVLAICRSWGLFTHWGYCSGGVCSSTVQGEFDVGRHGMSFPRQENIGNNFRYWVQ